MIAAGLGFGFMPQSCVKHPMVVARPIVDPEFWREVNLVTVRGRPHSPAVGALVNEAMRARWLGRPAIAAEAERVRRRRARSRLGRIGAMRRQTAELSPSRAASRSRGLEIRSCDEARSSLEAGINPGPVHGNDKPVPEPDQEVDVRGPQSHHAR